MWCQNSLQVEIELTEVVDNGAGNGVASECHNRKKERFVMADVGC